MKRTKMRIAYLITDLDVGGAERNLAMLAAGLDRTRYAPEVATLMPPGDVADDLRAAHVPVTSMNMCCRADVRVLPRLVRWLGEMRPDVLHTWLFHANFVGRLAAKCSGVRAVVSSIRVAEPRGYHLALERLTAPLARRIVVNSPSLLDYMVQAGIPRAKMTVIANGVDLARFAASAKGGDARLVFIGRLDRQKGVDVLLDAMAQVNIRKGLTLRIIGDGPDRASLEAQAGRLSLGNVEFAGRTDDVPAALASAEVLILPSRWEGLPNVVLEAMAAGVPVIGTDVVGTRDLIDDGRNGLVVPPEDPAALALTITRLLADGALREKVAAGGRKTAEAHSIEAMVASHQRLYETLA